MNGLNNNYHTVQNYTGLSSMGIQGQIYSKEGYQNKSLRQVDGKSYIVVNPLNMEPYSQRMKEKYGSFSIAAAVRPSVGSCGCGRNCYYKNVMGVS